MADGLSRDEIQALVNQRYDRDTYDTNSQGSFALLVDVASHVYQLYIEANPVNLDDPNSFKPATLGNVNLGWAMIQGLIENLEMHFPDASFRTMFDGPFSSF